MITGDNALTACHIAKEVEIVSRDVLICDVWSDGLKWKTVDEKKSFPIDLTVDSVPDKIKKYDLCVTGGGLAHLESSKFFTLLLPRLWVYARVSPSQKEMILSKLKEAGYTTLMCGDGTNDVGALKQAHVGIALLDGTVEGLAKIQEHQTNLRKQAILKKQQEIQERWKCAYNQVWRCICGCTIHIKGIKCNVCVQHC
jgi:cation-transporting ATPase 13A1